MPILAKNAEILLLLFTLNNFGQNSSVTEQQTSKWQKKSALVTTRNFTSKNKVFAVIDECRKVDNCLTTIKTQTIDNHFHDFHQPEESIHRPIHQMGFVHSTQIQNKSHRHPHLSLLQDLLLFGVAAICPWWASEASSTKGSPSRHNHLSH